MSVPQTQLGAAALLLQIRGCFDQGLHKSVEILGGFLLGFNDVTEHQALECLTIMAKSFKILGQNRRAMDYHERAIQKCTTLRSGDGPSDIDGIEADNRLQLAMLWMNLHDYKKARIQLEPIPAHLRSVEILMVLAQIFKYLRQHSLACEAYHQVLRKNPFAVEASIGLISLHLPDSPISSSALLASVSQDPQIFGLRHIPAFPEFVDGHVAFRELNVKDALVNFQKVVQVHPHHPYALTMLAAAQRQNQQLEKSLSTVNMINKIDEYHLDHLVLHASILHTVNDTLNLNKLAHFALENHDKSPDAYVVSAIYYDLRGNVDMGKKFVEQALVLDPLHRQALCLKGRVYFNIRCFHDAISCFRAALESGPFLEASQGVVDSYCELMRLKDAMVEARDAYKYFKNDARTLCLLGKVVRRSNKTEIKKKAIDYFRRALSIDATCVEAAVNIGEIYAESEEWAKATEMLESQLSNSDTPAIRCTLAGYYAKMSKYPESQRHYYAALSLDSKYEAALQGVVELDRIMSGGGDDSANAGPTQIDPRV
eukprot:c603_g1_i1.p1 GENE.c603_g1_i1~~c603_g1_i1.p1  ORF type:complete len:541 (-),score=136.97 c603_g1_i1:3-1625(-)